MNTNQEICLMHELIIRLMEFNSMVTGLPVPKKLPRLQFVPCIEDVDDGVAALASDGDIVFGLYDSRVKCISLLDTWKEDDIVDQSLLGHELVHYMQDKAGLFTVDLCSEPDAYFAQRAYMKAHGAEDSCIHDELVSRACRTEAKAVRAYKRNLKSELAHERSLKP